jgi:subtilisin family serine protease
MPRPQLDEPLILPLDARRPAEKIVATMPLALRSLEDPSSARIIVTLHEPLETPGPADSRAGARADRLRRIAAIEHDFADGASRLGFRATVGLTHFAIVAGEISPERLEHLAALRQVKAIEPDRTLRADLAEGKALINSNDVASLGGDGDGITVVVIDSGINASHGELAGKIDEQRSYNGPVGQDGFNHGTKVAGIIAGDNGLAPSARLWDIRVIDNNGVTTIAILVEALDDLMPNVNQIDVLVGAFSDPTIRFASACDNLDPASAQVVNFFRDAGKLLIGSTGNDADGAGIGIPACLEAILATGSVYDANIGSFTFGCTDSTTTADKIACYSNGGPLVDFYAPGHCTRSPSATGGFDNCFGGTSASAAYVAGAAAQIWSLRPQTSAAALENALKTNGPLINDPRSGTNRRRIDVLAAYQSVNTGGPTATPPGPTPTRTPTQPGPGPTPTKTPTLGPGNAPAAPSNLTAQALTHSAILVQWTDGSTNETTFRIEARSGAGSFQEVGNVPANTTFFTVEELAPSTHYDFRVRARNAAGNSNFSNIAGANTFATTAPCVRDNNTACLLNGKFRITGEMKNFATPPQTFPLKVMDFPGGRAESTQAAFWESFNAGNFEIAIKMNDACSLQQGHPLRFYWAFFGGLTDQRTDMLIVDTLTAQEKTFHNPPNTFPTTITDTMAFPCTTPGAAGPCTPNQTTACLLGGRFRVTGSMRNAQNQVFTTKVMQFPGALSLTPRNRAETDQAAFFESFNPGNFEIGVKMVDACSLAPGHPLRFYWIFYGGLTNAATEVRAVHTTTGRVDLWRNPSGTAPTTEGRTMAFACQ